MIQSLYPTSRYTRTFSSGLLLLLFCSFQALASYVSHQLNGNILTIQGDEEKIRITAFTPDVVEVFYQPDNMAQLPSFAIDPHFTPANLNPTLNETDDHLYLNTGKLKVVIEKAQLKLSYYRANNLLIQEELGLFHHQTLRGFRFALSTDEKIMGGGSRVVGMDRRGLRLPLYNKAHYGYGSESTQMSYGLPAIMSDKKYILLFDNSAKGHLDIAHSEANILQFEAVSGRTSYLLFSGDSYPDLINHYVTVTGKQPLPPRWALGNFASRFGYRSEAEVRETVAKFIEQGMPLDAVVLDLYWFGETIKGTMGNLDWHKPTFPTPTQLIADLEEKGVKTIVITEPFVLTSSLNWQSAVDHNALAKNLAGEPKIFDFYFGNSGLVDIFNHDGQKWLLQTYEKLAKQGIQGWWGDLGEPEAHPADTIHQLDPDTKVTADEIHNVYGHKWTEQLYRKHQALLPHIRPFILMRSGFAGTQRYGIIPWTGDVSRSFAGLSPQVELSLQMGLFGLGYTHSDLGGFAGGERFDSELYTRWLQYGTFQPIYRPHAQDHIASEPVFHDKKTRDIVKRFIQLRYNLLPYNYSLAWQNSTSGLPLMRPVFFSDEQQKALIDRADSYLWGDAFLVHPITEAGLTSVSVALPKGVWFDYWSNQKYQGNQTISYPTSIETLPVFVKAGEFIPMIDDIATTKQYSSERLNLHYYADISVPTGSGFMYEDDGISPDSLLAGKWEKLHFNAQQQENQLTLLFQRVIGKAGGYQNMPASRNIHLTVHNWLASPNKIQLFHTSDSDTLPAIEITQYRWDKKTKKLMLQFEWQHQPISIKIDNQN